MDWEEAKRGQEFWSKVEALGSAKLFDIFYGENAFNIECECPDWPVRIVKMASYIVILA